MIISKRLDGFLIVLFLGFKVKFYYGRIHHLFKEPRNPTISLRVDAFLVRCSALWHSPSYHASIYSKHAAPSLGFILSIFQNVFIVGACGIAHLFPIFNYEDLWFLWRLNC